MASDNIAFTAVSGAYGPLPLVGGVDQDLAYPDVLPATLRANLREVDAGRATRAFPGSLWPEARCSAQCPRPTLSLGRARSMTDTTGALRGV